jgi:hypothetical protein
MVKVRAPRDDPVEALADELCRRGEDPMDVFDLDDVRVAVVLGGVLGSWLRNDWKRGRFLQEPEFVPEDGEDGKEVEPEWLTNPDVFPTLDTMALPEPRRKGGRRPRRAAARRRSPVPATPPRSGTPAKERKQCEHCRTVDTPQWRRARGPGGLLTLCNACGMRSRKGKLLPEYRPKNSPTFAPGLHSNKHRRVLDMASCRGQAEESAKTSPAAGDWKSN